MLPADVGRNQEDSIRKRDQKAFPQVLADPAKMPFTRYWWDGGIRDHGAYASHLNWGEDMVLPHGWE